MQSSPWAVFPPSETKMNKRRRKLLSMRLQVIQDGQGKNTGVFIPIEDWTLIKNQYPDIENAGIDLPQWEKDLIDERLDTIAKNPERLKTGEQLIQELKRKI